MQVYQLWVSCMWKYGAQIKKIDTSSEEERAIEKNVSCLPQLVKQVKHYVLLYAYFLIFIVCQVQQCSHAIVRNCTEHNLYLVLVDCFM